MYVYSKELNTVGIGFQNYFSVYNNPFGTCKILIFSDYEIKLE